MRLDAATDVGPVTPRMAYRNGHVVITGVLGTLWTLERPAGGPDARFVADCRYAAAFHDVPASDVTAALQAAGAADPEPAFDGEEP